MSNPTVSDFSQRKAVLENGLNKAGFSSQMIEDYHRKVYERLGQFIAALQNKVGSQAIYDVTTNFPTGIIDSLESDRAEVVVLEAVVHALGTFIKWDLDTAKDLAVELLHDVNYHDAAEYLAKYERPE